jgi:hypothetical protein
MQQEQDSKNTDFEKLVAWGEEAEDVVYDYLIKNNSSVVDLRKQKRDEGRGPRLIGTEGSFVLPDFGVYNKNPNKGTFAVDVKRKSAIYKFNGKKCFTVDKKFEQYKVSSQIMRFDYLAIIFSFEDRLYFYKADESIGFEYKSNEYGAGNVYYFEYDKSKIRY